VIEMSNVKMEDGTLGLGFGEPRGIRGAEELRRFRTCHFLAFSARSFSFNIQTVSQQPRLQAQKHIKQNN